MCVLIICVNDFNENDHERIIKIHYSVLSYWLVVKLLIDNLIGEWLHVIHVNTRKLTRNTRNNPYIFWDLWIPGTYVDVDCTGF